MAIHYCEIFSIQCFSSRRKKKPKKKAEKKPKKSRHTQIQPPNQIFARKMNIDFVTN
jgi:hypothetical protein